MRAFFRAIPWIIALCLGSRLCLAEGVELDAATPAQKAAAGTAYKHGLSLFNAQKLEEALQAFRDSYDEVKSPNSRLMIGRTLAGLKRWSEAEAEFEATVSEAEKAATLDEKYRQTAKAARAELDALEQKVARLQVRVTGGTGTVTVDGKALTPEQLTHPVIVDAGPRTVVLEVEGERRVEQTVDAEAGKVVTVSLAAPPKPAPPAPPTPASNENETDSKRIMAYVFGGVGVASIATFAVLGSMSSSKYSDLRNACSGQTCPADQHGLAETGKHQQTAANAALFVGLFALGTSGVLFWQSVGDSGPSESSLSLRVGAGSVTMDGKF